MTIPINDPNLVALYRFEEAPYISGQQLNNATAATRYFGLNTMQTSGSDVVSVSGAVPLSSGVFIGSGLADDTGTPFAKGDFFGVSATSGNISGLQATSGDSISFGGWISVSGIEGGGDWNIINRWSDTGDDDGIWFNLNLVKSFNEMKYEANIGTESGSNSTHVQSPPVIDSTTSGTYQHVVAVANGAAGTLDLYISGVQVSGRIDTGNGAFVYAPEGSGTALDLIMPFRIGAITADSTDLYTSADFGFQGSGEFSELFFMNRALSSGEVFSLFESGFVASTFSADSDDYDTLKDNIGVQSSLSTIQITAWDANNAADPSGSRHMTSGYHPSWLKIVGEGAGSGLNFGRITQHTTSGIKAITIRNTTNATILNNIRFWMSDISAFAGVTGWEVSQHIDSKWLPNLTLPSGSGTVSRTLAAASSIFQSDGATVISGGVIDGTVTSGESGISQYIYLSFHTNENFTPSTYGPTGFVFRITSDNV